MQKPAAHVHVFAAEIAYQNGERILNQIQGADSDDRGNYRLFWLPPGKYVIVLFRKACAGARSLRLLDRPPQLRA
jgi:hypothetical protein